MRIIAGRLGGRIFEAPNGHRTHPMSEKIRGAIFNALGDIEGLTVLDPFSGSGALCFEAMSRGASSAQAIDADKGAYKIIQKNIETLSLDEEVSATNAYADSWSTRHKAELFDLVFLDPPYDNVVLETAEKLAYHAKPGGIAVFSLPPEARIVLAEKDFELVSRKDYGDATLAFYRRTK